MKGEKGDSGVSPTIDVEKTNNVTTITITDAEGTKTATIYDGAGEGNVAVDPTLSVEGMAADAKAVGDELGSRAHTTQILYSAPTERTEGYTGQIAFDDSGRKLYVCTDGIVETEFGELWPSWFTWKQLSEYKFVNSAPTRDTYGTYGEIWVNFSEPAIYICAGTAYIYDDSTMSSRVAPPPGTETYTVWYKIAGLPEFTEEDEGKTLQIENGVMVWKGGSDAPESGESSSPSAPDIDTESIYMRVYNGYIQYSEDEDTWYDVIEVSELKGDPGATPQKGVDYWTESDKSEIVADVLAALPTWEGGSY